MEANNAVRLLSAEINPYSGDVVVTWRFSEKPAVGKPRGELSAKVLGCAEFASLREAVAQARDLNSRLADAESELDSASANRQALGAATAKTLAQVKTADEAFTIAQNRRNSIASDLQVVTDILTRGCEALVTRFAPEERMQQPAKKKQARERVERAQESLLQVSGAADAVCELRAALAEEAEIWRVDLPPHMGGNPPLSAGDIGRIIVDAA